MRLRIIPLLAGLLLCMQMTAQLATFQRIGIAAGEMLTLESGVNLASVASYCMDANKSAPDEYLMLGLAKPSYNKILSAPSGCKVYLGDSKTGISLQEAVNKGFLTYEMNGYQEVNFLRGPNYAGRFTIRFDSPTVFGNAGDNTLGLNTAALQNKKVLDPLTQKYFGKEYNKEIRQSIIWKQKAPTITRYIQDVQDYLKILNIYKGPVDGKTTNTVAALKIFNRKMKLAEDAPWNIKNFKVFEDFYIDAFNVSMPDDVKTIPGFLKTDDAGISTYIIKGKDKNYIVKAAFDAREEFSITDFALFDDLFITELEADFVQKIKGAGTDKIKAGYITSITNKNEAAMVVNGEHFALHLDAASEPYHQLVSQTTEQLQKREVKEITFFADDLKRQGFGEGDFKDSLLSFAGRSFINLPRFIHDLSKTNPHIRFYISSDYKNFAERIHTMPGIKGKEDMHLLIPEQSFSNTDIISETQLKRIADNGLAFSKVSTYSAPAEMVASNIIAYTGDNGWGFQGFLRRQSSNDQFKDKILILFSCHTPEDILNYSRLIEEAGLKGIYFYPYKVDPIAVRYVLQKMGKFIREPLNREEVPAMIKKVVQEVLKDIELEPDQLKNEVMKLENLIIHAYQKKSILFTALTELS
ncbi:MAG TPA: hypothetical protein VF487_18370 [Chitinophagaceae bacterium]